MDFDLDDLISTDAQNNAKASTKFQPKAKPKPRPKPKPKTQPEPKSTPSPSTQSVEAAVINTDNGLVSNIEEEHQQPENDVNHISGNINNDWHSSFEKSQENPESFLTLESLNGFLPESTTATEAQTYHVSVEGNSEKGSIEPELTNNIDDCTNLERIEKLHPLTEDFSIGNLSSEPFDILSQSRTYTGQKVGKFKPKPKSKTRIMEQIATNLNQDEISVQYEENIHSVSSQFDYVGNNHDPSFTPDEILDSVQMETISDLHVNEEPINMDYFPQLDSVIPEIPSQGTDSVKKGKKQTRKQQDQSPNTENQSSRSSERLRRQSYKSLELIDEPDDEAIDNGFLHGNEVDNNDDNDNGDYIPENEAISEKKKGRKSKKLVDEKEKPVRKRKKANEVPVESAKAPKKKFAHSTRRNKRQVNPELLKIPEDEFEFHMHNVPMKDLIRLAEHRERMAKKEASTSGTPAMNQSSRDFSNHYDEHDAFTQDNDSGDQRDDSMVAENATYYNYRTHMKITPRAKWTKQDTELFYEAVQQFGTDLAMIKECFPGRTREQIKSKFKKEERQQPLRLNDALTTRFNGISHFEIVLDRLKQARAQDSDNEDPIMLGEEEEEEDVEADGDATKPIDTEKQVKDVDTDIPATVGSPTKSHDSDDDMYRWSQYKSEI